jgi:hypothetical protein
MREIAIAESRISEFAVFRFPSNAIKRFCGDATMQQPAFVHRWEIVKAGICIAGFAEMWVCDFAIFTVKKVLCSA